VSLQSAFEGIFSQAKQLGALNDDPYEQIERALAIAQAAPEVVRGGHNHELRMAASLGWIAVSAIIDKIKAELAVKVRKQNWAKKRLMLDAFTTARGVDPDYRRYLRKLFLDAHVILHGTYAMDNGMLEKADVIDELRHAQRFVHETMRLIWS